MSSSEDQQTAPPQPPTPDENTYKHFQHVVDAVTRGPVTSKTTLAALYGFDSPDIDNRFLRNITGISEPRIPTQLHVLGGMVEQFPIPAALEPGTGGVKAYLMFSLLMIAPAVRLEVEFTDEEQLDPRPFHTVALEFSFNERMGKKLAFKISGDDRTGWKCVSCLSSASNCEGFAELAQFEDRLSDTQKRVIKTLRSLVRQMEPKPLEFLLQTQSLSASDLAEFDKLCMRLPGGSGHTFSSIGVADFSNFPGVIDRIQRPLNLMTLPAHNPMVPLHCGDVFRSPEEWRTQSIFAAVMSNWEGYTGLHQWAQADHKATVYRWNDLAVLAMKFGKISNIGNASKESPCRLPNGLEIHFGLSSHGEEFTATHEAHLPGLPPHEAYFVITSHDINWFVRRSTMNDADDEKPQDRYVNDLRPHENSFLIASLVRAATTMIENPQHHIWHPILLCQDFAGLRHIDTTAGLTDQGIEQSAFAWLLKCKPWNEEQKKVIEQIKSAFGRMILCTGIAGTGKTLLQMAMALCFVKLGGRAFCTATGNTNADHLANAMVELSTEVHGMNLRVYRIYSTSRSVGLKDLSPAQALHKVVGHVGGKVTNLSGLKFALIGEKMETMEAYDYSLEKGVIQEAEKKELKHMVRLEYDSSGRETGDLVDAWSCLREYLQADMDGKFDWDNKTEKKKFERCYDACKGQLIALADVIITTNGNSRCRELVDYWGEAPKLFDIKVKALGVFIDEVAKEQEICVWNTITSPALPRIPDLVVLFGDPEQLAPINTSTTNGMQFNCFAGRCDISLMGRLIRKGLPHVVLTEQMRMHPILSRFPNKEFYRGTLKNYTGVERSLEAVRPGLKEWLHSIIGKSIYDEREKTDFIFHGEMSDEQYRLRYIDFGIGHVSENDNHSVAITKHIDGFFQCMLENLQCHFGDRTNREVMLIVAYGHAIGHYKRRMHELKELEHREDAFYPRILTVDSAQGQEATVVILDASIQYSDVYGFMRDRGPSNVAMTRAKEVFWIVGGPLGLAYPRNAFEPDIPLVKLKKELEANGQVTVFE